MNILPSSFIKIILTNDILREQADCLILPIYADRNVNIVTLSEGINNYKSTILIQTPEWDIERREQQGNSFKSALGEALKIAKSNNSRSVNIPPLTIINQHHFPLKNEAFLMIVESYKINIDGSMIDILIGCPNNEYLTAYTEVYKQLFNN